MLAKPLVGLNADYRPIKQSTPALTYVYAGYYDAICAAGGVPIILPPVEEEADVERMVDLVDALVLVGGADLDPRRDGFMVHPSQRLLDPRREQFDRFLIDHAFNRRLPVFGIGAGMQLLNVARGGNLFLHLAEDMPRALPHDDSIDPAHRHTLDVTPGTLMERIYGEGEIRVNSVHHMAIDEVAADFQVSARCPDGVIEAIESVRPDWLAMGTQFHPEASSASALDQRIFEEFIDGVRAANAEMRLVA